MPICGKHVGDSELDERLPRQQRLLLPTSRFDFGSYLH